MIGGFDTSEEENESDPLETLTLCIDRAREGLDYFTKQRGKPIFDANSFFDHKTLKFYKEDCVDRFKTISAVAESILGPSEEVQRNLKSINDGYTNLARLYIQKDKRGINEAQKQLVELLITGYTSLEKTLIKGSESILSMPEVQVVSSSTCNKCGKTNPPEANFCMHCGLKLKQTE